MIESGPADNLLNEMGKEEMVFLGRVEIIYIWTLEMRGS